MRWHNRKTLTQWWIYIESKYITGFFRETLPFVEKGSIKEKWPYYVDPWLLFLENWPFTQSWKSVLDPSHLMKNQGAFQTLEMWKDETIVINQWVKEFYEQILWRIERQSSWEGPAFPKEKTIYGVNVMGAIRKLFSYWFSLKWEENGFLSSEAGRALLLYAGRCNLKVVTWKMNCQFILHPFTIIQAYKKQLCLLSPNAIWI